MLQFDNSSFNPENQLTIILVNNESSSALSIKKALEDSKNDLLKLSAGILILNSNNSSLTTLASVLNPQQHAILICNNNGEVLWHKVEFNYPDCVSVLTAFIQNYFEDVAQLEVFKWGNKILAEGDYLCLDCGYILTVSLDSDYKVGMVFPTCEVCQAGEPGGPSNPSDAFWQKL